MVVGTGIDMIEVDRIQRASVREAFLNRIFTEYEQAYYRSCGCNPQTLAGMFAAKEATMKALSAGFHKIGWRDIEIMRDDTGKPYAKLSNGARKRMLDLGGNRVHVSISHIKSLAVAQAILEE